MVPQRSRQIFSYFLLACVCLSCDDDETPEPVKITHTFTIDVSPGSYNPNDEYVISDYSGKILLSAHFTRPGVNNLDVLAPEDERFHLTIFSSQLVTYAFAPPGYYRIRPVSFPQLNGAPGMHRLNVPNFFLQEFLLGGTSLWSWGHPSSEVFDIFMISDKTDLLFTWPVAPGPGKFVYVPELLAGDTTTIPYEDFVSARDLESVNVTFPPGFLVLRSTTNPQDSVFNIQLLARNYDPVLKNFDLPPEDIRKNFRRYLFQFFNFNDGSNYEAHVDFLPTTIRSPKFSNADARFENGAIAYSIKSSESGMVFNGFGSGLSWLVHAPFGTNMKINLPRFDEAFKRAHDIRQIDAIGFSSATVIGDSRATTYYEYLRYQLDQGAVTQTSNFDIAKVNFGF